MELLVVYLLLCLRGSLGIPKPAPLQEPSATQPTVMTPSGCVLPKASPTIRKFCSLAPGCEDCDVSNRQCRVPPGSRVDKVRVVCAPGYETKVSDVAVCLGKEWYPSIPECIKISGHSDSVKSVVRRQVTQPSTEATTKIPPGNPEVATIYRVSCPCPFTPQYAPVCGSDGQNYGNIQILNCARFCGSKVSLVYSTACGKNRG